MKTYAVLLAPEFRLQATLRHTAELANLPVALLEKSGTKFLVGEIGAVAKASMVQRGMSPTQALARCPALRLLNSNPGHERSAQEVLLQTAETLSPFIEATGPGVITVELPQERPFDKAELEKRLVAPLGLLGLDVRIGVAKTPDLALLAARFASPVEIVNDARHFLTPLPCAALEPSGELTSILHSWGIGTIGQFVALPREQVWERLGMEAVTLWERATGGVTRPLRLVKAQAFYRESAELENAVEMLEPLLFLLRRFLEKLSARLANVYLVASRLRLVLRFENELPYQHIFTIPQPTREVELLFRMLHTHLENFTSESPITALELAVKPVRPNAEQFGLLEKGVRDPHQFAETLARLEALLGPDRVGSPEIEPSHHPDAFHLRPYAIKEQNAESTPSLLVGIPYLHFRPPIEARIIVNDNRPAYLYSAHTTGEVKDVRGPWHAEGKWWEPHCWAREEWDIATADGFYRLVRVANDWFLDGIYA